jgi:hypothetical protein
MSYQLHNLTFYETHGWLKQIEGSDGVAGIAINATDIRDESSHTLKTEFLLNNTVGCW